MWLAVWGLLAHTCMSHRTLVCGDWFSDRFQGSPLVRVAVPYTAVVGAGIVNLILIRQSELVDGVSVFDSTGKSNEHDCCRFRMLPISPSPRFPSRARLSHGTPSHTKMLRSHHNAKNAPSSSLDVAAWHGSAHVVDV